MKVSAAIMAHPDREDYVTELREHLGESVPVAWDLEGPPNNDTEKRWRNGVRAWESYDPEADWHVVIQDDALVAPDLLWGLEKALDHVPRQSVVSLYSGTKRPSSARWDALAIRAEQEGATWIVAPSLLWGVAIALPTDTIPDMIPWCSRRGGQPYDLRIGKYYSHMGYSAYFTWPSLADHRDGPSLVHHGVKGRNARKFANHSVLSIDWGGPVIYDPRVRPGRVRRGQHGTR